MVRLKQISEHKLQCTVAKYIRTKYRRALFCATLGGVSCGSIEKDKMKKAGYQNGIPDIMFYQARHGYQGFGLELKRTKYDKMRPEQLEWRDQLVKYGWAHHCSHDIDDIYNWIDWYLGRKKKPQNCGARMLIM